MSTTTTLPNGAAPLPTLPELQAGAIATLDHYPPTHPQTSDNGSLSSLWTLLNERVARAANPTPMAYAPQVQATDSVAAPTPVTAVVPDGFGTAVSETYVVADTTLAIAPTIAPHSVAAPIETSPAQESITETQVTEPPAPVAKSREVLTPSSVTATLEQFTLTPIELQRLCEPLEMITTVSEPPTVTPLKELLTANAHRKTAPPVRLENALRGNTFVMSAHSQGERLPHIMLELSAPLGKTVQTASRMGENSTESNLLATLESIETGGEGKTSLKAVVGYTSTTPDIVIEVSCNNDGDWQFQTQENGSDVSVEWEVTRQKGKAIVIAATIGRAKGAEDVIIELSRTLITPTTDGVVTPQWRNLAELKQPER